ncbi:thioesterase family protein [Treponema sp. UBA3813]|uniref:acyl-CoA thioesterase n=1 Tax=Treponema sp. UBA3813 TaxID=1947715 RepID=UPI001B14B258|nr:acyl-CoA thioesterase [Treponema sp. UBA3813]MBO6219957.1 acyl-CoA thioesterase [Treponema sp.]
MEVKAYKHTVQYYETDKMGITHHSNYVRWMEEARVDFLKQIGWDYARLESEGIISPVVGVSCRYKHSTTFSDTVTISVAVEEYSGIKLKLKYSMQNENGESVCEGNSEHCFVNAEGKIVMIKKEYPTFHELLTSLCQSQQK